MIKLHVFPADGRPFDRKVREDSLVAGRSSKADLVLVDSSMSRRHARIFSTVEGWFIEDLGSRNGTYVNGDRVRHLSQLKPGDLINMGNSTIRVLSIRGRDWDSGSSSGSSAPVKTSPTGEPIFRPVNQVMRDDLATHGDPDARDEFSLRRYVDGLKIMNDVHHALSSTVELQGLFDVILDKVFEHLTPEQGAIFLKQGDGDYRLAAVRSVAFGEEEFTCSRSLIREVAEKGAAALVLDARTDARFSQALSLIDAGVKSLVAAPLIDPGGVLGIVVLTSRSALRQFTEEDMDLLVCMASVAALRIRNVALTEEAAARRQLEKEVELARRIQVALLPDRLPAVPGFEFFCGNIPSRGVSGDFYEFVERLGGRECLAWMADVSGKGIAASLLTASLEALSAAPIQEGLPPGEIFSRVSKLLFDRTSPEKYATAVMVALDCETAKMRYANAGHSRVLFIERSKSVGWLSATGLPLGMFPEARYEQTEFAFCKGDLLVLYSDGITEARNPQEEEYGQDRLARVCAENLEASLTDLNAAIEGDLTAFVEGVPFADDRTIVMIRRTGG
jgi:serine phosphatase RsbU (regulator of sigma subunit)/pSer/pThr/pTyr-binding forkhead associated (FHA) protein